MDSKAKKPDFLGIGAQRSATTWLYKVLVDHKDIYLPPVKELHYFDRIDRQTYDPRIPTRGFALYKKSKSRYYNNFAKVVRFAFSLDFKSIRFYRRFLFDQRNDIWYESLFENKKALAGEITPAYATLSAETIDQILSINPEIRIIYLLRHPVARAWSQFQYEIKRSEEHISSTNQAERFHDFILADRQLIHGNYSNVIKRWRSKLKKNSLFVGFYDAIVYQPNLFLQSLAAFLKIADLHNKPRINASTGEEIPDECYFFGLEIYQEMLRELSDQYGSYFIDWKNGILVSSEDRKVSWVL